MNRNDPYHINSSTVFNYLAFDRNEVISLNNHIVICYIYTVADETYLKIKDSEDYSNKYHKDFTQLLFTAHCSISARRKMPNLVIPTIIRSLHNIFTSIWIGGMLVMVLTFLPAIRKEINDKKLQGKVINKILILQSKWVYIGIVVLAVSGLLMTRFSGKTMGLFDFGSRYSTILSIKHILVIVISVIAVIRSSVFRFAAVSEDKSKKKFSMALLLVNTFLGTVILVLSSVNAVIK